MINKIILASRSEVRKEILDQNGINNEVIPANVDENQIKESLLHPLCFRVLKSADHLNL